MKKLILLTLFLVLAAGVYCTAPAEEPLYENGFFYEVQEDGTARITGYDYSVFPSTASLVPIRTADALRELNPAYDMVLPSELDGHPVSAAVIEPAIWAYTYIPETVVHLEVRMPQMKDLSEYLLNNDFRFQIEGMRRLTDTVCFRTTDGHVDYSTDHSANICVEIAENNPAYTVIDGIVYEKSGETLVFAANSSQTRQTSPGDEFAPICVREGTKRIGDYAFANCMSGTVVILPDSVTEYGTDCFPYGVEATRYTVSVYDDYNGGYYYFVQKSDGSLMLTGWNGVYIGGLGRLYSTDGKTVMIIPNYNMYVFNLPSETSGGAPVTEAMLDPNSFTCIYIPSSITSVTFRDKVTEDMYNLCLVKTDENEFYPVRETTDPQMLFIEEDHPAFSVRNGMLYDKAGETLIFCPRRGTAVKLPEGTMRVLKNAFRSWPGGTVIAAEDGVEWEEQTLRDGSAPVIVSVSDYAPVAETDEKWTPDTFYIGASMGFIFPEKSGTAVYYFDCRPDDRKPLVITGDGGTRDSSYKGRWSRRSDDSNEFLLQKSSETFRVPSAISAERFEFFTDKMDKPEKKFIKNLYTKKDPARLQEYDQKNQTSEFEELSRIYPDLAEGITLWIIPYDLLSPEEKEAKATTIHDNLVCLEEDFAYAGYTDEDYEYDMSRVNPAAWSAFDYSLSCTTSETYDGRNLTCTFTDFSLTSASYEKCEYITLNPKLCASLPVLSGFVYMPEMLIEDAIYHPSCAEDRWDYLYADLDAGVNELPVYSQRVPDGTYVCIVTSDMPIRVRVPVDQTYLSTAAGEYARVQILTDENGNAAGNVTVRYEFIPDGQ